MEIIVKGYEKSSLIEWPGKIVSIVFTGGCNFRCPFCHNGALVTSAQNYEDLDFFKILEDIKSRRDWIDAVEITGGEPTLHPHLRDMLKIIKKEGFLTKLDTNGTNPRLLKELLDEELIDYVAMDVKNSKDKYSETAGVDVDISKIMASIKIIMEYAPDYEFRTTVLPKHHNKEDLKQLFEWIAGAKRFFLQNFKPLNTLNPEYEKERSFSEEELKEFKDLGKRYIKEVDYR